MLMAIASVKTTINGIEHSLTFNSGSGKWEATMTAPSGSSFNLSGGYYNVSVTATDSADNSATVNASHPTLGDSLKLYVRERQVPVITISSPGAGAYVTTSAPVFSFTLRDNAIGSGGDSGIDISTLSFKIDSGSAITNTSNGMVCTQVAGGYDCTYTPQSAIPDGEHTISVNVKDNDNNSAVEKTRSFTVDTVAPSLNVTSPVSGIETNEASQTVIGTTNDSTSAPVTVVIMLNGASQGSVTVDAEGDFSKEITLVEGENTIVVTATDMAGRSTSVTRTVTLKTTAPVFSSIVIEPNPLDAGATYIIRVEVSDE
jgi:hypothetical protein